MVVARGRVYDVRAGALARPGELVGVRDARHAAGERATRQDRLFGGVVRRRLEDGREVRDRRGQPRVRIHAAHPRLVIERGDRLGAELRVEDTHLAEAEKASAPQIDAGVLVGVVFAPNARQLAARRRRRDAHHRHTGAHAMLRPGARVRRVHGGARVKHALGRPRRVLVRDLEQHVGGRRPLDQRAELKRRLRGAVFVGRHLHVCVDDVRRAVAVEVAELEVRPAVVQRLTGVVRVVVLKRRCAGKAQLLADDLAAAKAMNPDLLLRGDIIVVER